MEIEADYIKNGVEYYRLSKVSGKLGKSTDTVGETVKRLKLKRLVVMKERKLVVIPQESIERLREYYKQKAARRPKKRNYPKDMRNEMCVLECAGCIKKTVKNKCSVSIDPGYQWRKGKCWIRELWEKQVGE